MPRLGRTDKLLLGTLLPLFAVVLALHVKEIVRTGQSQPPVFAVPVAGSEYPAVGGLRLERGQEPQGLRPGDLLISVGGEDLAGVGHFGFDAIVLEKAGREGRVPLVTERDGVRREREIVMLSHTIPWFRVPFLLSLVFAGTIVLRRAPEKRFGRAFFAMCLAGAILETPFLGGPRLQSLAHHVVFTFGGSAAIFFVLRGLALFPPEVPEERRASTRWAWLALLHSLVRLNYLLGGPVPPPIVPTVVLATDAFLGATVVGLVTWNYANALPIGRRRLKWGLLGLYVGTLPMIATMLLPVLGLQASLEFHRVFQWSALAAVAVPVGILIAVARYNLFDIDRLVGATATASVLAAGFVALVIGATPAVSAALAAATGVDEGSARVLLGLAFGALLLPAGRWLRGGIDRLLFPDRAEKRRGIEKLLDDLSESTTAGDVGRLLADRIFAVLRPTSCAVYAATWERLLRMGAHGPAPVPAFAADGELAVALAGRSYPLSLGDDGDQEQLEALSGDERASLAAAGFQVLVPVMERTRLAAVIGLGPLRSGDVYTSTDLSLLQSAAERASAVLQRLRDEETIREERVRSERLEALHEAAEAAQAARSRFLAAASHDLRQPLHALGMYAELLSEQLGSEAAPRTVDRLRQSTESLRDMFTSLLDLSRLDVGGVEPDVRAFPLAVLIEQVTADVAPLAEQKGLALRATPCDEQVRSDPVLLGRILRNLLTNAIRYTERGEVTVEVAPAGDDVAIEVVDTGPGIEPERQAEIFREFVRGEGGDDHGLGLGLTIVERLAHVLGHPVDLHSEPGKGSRFRLRVPRVRGRATDPADAAEGAPASLTGRVVVVIDDDLAVLGATRDLLEAWGCRVLVAETAVEALAGLEARGLRPDLLLADYRLADAATGLDAVARLRAAFGRSLPAAILSGDATPEMIQRVREDGLVRLAKPLAPARLRAVLLQLLR